MTQQLYFHLRGDTSLFLAEQQGEKGKELHLSAFAMGAELGRFVVELRRAARAGGERGGGEAGLETTECCLGVFSLLP